MIINNYRYFLNIILKYGTVFTNYTFCFHYIGHYPFTHSSSRRRPFWQVYAEQYFQINIKKDSQECQ